MRTLRNSLLSAVAGTFLLFCPTIILGQSHTSRRTSSAGTAGISPKSRRRYLNLRKTQITDRSSSSPIYINSR